MKRFYSLAMLLCIHLSAHADTQRGPRPTLRIVASEPAAEAKDAPKKEEYIPLTFGEKVGFGVKETLKGATSVAAGVVSGGTVGKAAALAHQVVPYVGPAIVAVAGYLAANSESKLAKEWFGESHGELNNGAFWISFACEAAEQQKK